MLTDSELRKLVTLEVRDREGESLGYVECLFADRETGRPEWLGVMTGKVRHHHVLVPVAEVERANGTVTVPWSKEQVKAAPDYGKADHPISEDMEREAYRHYGLERSAPPA
jgi:PRC-barrel domain